MIFKALLHPPYHYLCHLSPLSTPSKDVSDLMDRILHCTSDRSRTNQHSPETRSRLLVEGHPPHIASTDKHIIQKSTGCFGQLDRPVTVPETIKFGSVQIDRPRPTMLIWTFPSLSFARLKRLGHGTCTDKAACENHLGRRQCLGDALCKQCEMRTLQSAHSQIHFARYGIAISSSAWGALVSIIDT